METEDQKVHLSSDVVLVLEKVDFSFIFNHS